MIPTVPTMIPTGERLIVSCFNPYKVIVIIDGFDKKIAANIRKGTHYAIQLLATEGNIYNERDRKIPYRTVLSGEALSDYTLLNLEDAPMYVNWYWMSRKLKRELYGI